MALTLLQRFRLLIPPYPKGVFSDEEVQEMLDIANTDDYRPSCLSQTKQDEAVILYAAYLLSLREAANDAKLQDVAWRRRAGIASEREGDLSKSYVKGSDSLALDSDPRGYLARWQELWGACRRLQGGSIFVGNGDFERSLPEGFRRGGW